MKRNWKVTSLGEVCAFDKDQGIHHNLPYVGLEDIESNTGRLVGSVEARSTKSSTFKFSDKHVLYGRLRPYLNKVLVPNFQGHCSTEIFPIKPGPELCREYLSYWFLNDETAERINATCKGARMPRADMNEVMEFSLPLPPLSEQQRTVGILDHAFEAIATAKAYSEKNHQNARALFEDYLKSIFSRYEGRVERQLIEVSREFGRGKSKHRPRNEPALYGGPYPFVQTGDISRADHWLTTHTQTYNEIGLAQSRLWPAGTVCVALVGATVGESAILDFEACFPDSVIGIVVDEKKANNEYVEYMLQAFKAFLKEKGKGTARDNINLRTFENQRFPFPPLKLQTDIVTTLNALGEETRHLASVYEHKLAALEAFKKSLLYHAFAGTL